MKCRLVQLPKCMHRQPMLQAVKDKLPPPEVIDDWLRREREKRERKREQPAISPPMQVPAVPMEKKKEPGPEPVTIQLTCPKKGQN